MDLLLSASLTVNREYIFCCGHHYSQPYCFTALLRVPSSCENFFEDCSTGNGYIYNVGIHGDVMLLKKPLISFVLVPSLLFHANKFMREFTSLYIIYIYFLLLISPS